MHRITNTRFIIDYFSDSQTVPSPSTGEGQGEGDPECLTISLIPLPLIPSRQGRGNFSLYGVILLQKNIAVLSIL